MGVTDIFGAASNASNDPQVQVLRRAMTDPKRLMIVDNWGAPGEPTVGGLQSDLKPPVGRMPSAASQPAAQPSQPAAQPPQPANPTTSSNATTGTSGMSGEAPTSSSPAYISRFLDADRQAIDTAHKAIDDLGARPEHVDPGKWNKIAAIIAAATTGWGHGAGEGLKTGREILDRPTHDAQALWESNYKKAQRGYEDSLQKFNVDLAGNRAQGEASDRAAQEAERNQNAAYRKWQMEGGPEKTRIDLENQDRQSKSDQLRKGGYSERDIAEFNAIGKLERQQPEANDIELLVKAHEVGPDGQPTPAARQAAEAHKQHHLEELQKIHATRDPNEQVKMWRDLQTNDVAKRGQLEHELTSVESNPLSRSDPASQARINVLKKSISDIDSDLEVVNDQIRKGAGMKPAADNRPAPIAQFQGSQNFTISAEGKPSVQKSLTYQEVQQLQSQGVQVSPAQASKPAGSL